METQLIKFITTSSDLVYTIRKGEVWSGYFILAGNKSRDVSISCSLVGSGASSSITVVNFLSGHAKVVLHTIQRHSAKNTQSKTLVKTVVSESAIFEYKGSIRVDKNADKTNAYERNENIILSDEANVVSSPLLEILADDVRCTHGVATGGLPKEELWYLKTRGLTEYEAQAIYIRGFLGSALADLDESRANTVLRRIMDI